MLPSLLALDKIKHEEPFLLTRFGREQKFFYVFTPIEQRVLAQMILAGVDFLEIILSTVMLSTYFQQRDQQCLDGDSVLYYYIPIACILGYLAFARGFVLIYLFVYRARKGLERTQMINDALDQMAGRYNLAKYTFTFPMMPYQEYKD